MDFFIYSAATIIAWTLSVTCLLPFVIVLKISKAFRHVWFSFCFARIIEFMLGTALGRVRKSGFKFLAKHLRERKDGTPLEILEIGFGGGMNFPYYPENCNLTALDMNESFTQYFEERRKKYPQVNCKKVIIAMAEDMREIDDDTFDVVVGSYVLCSVESVQSALREVKRVLKPDGKYLFVEHILYPNYGWQAMLQILINPIWKIYFNGCHVNRNHEEEIKKTAFSDVATKMCIQEDLWLYVRPTMIGIATK